MSKNLKRIFITSILLNIILIGIFSGHVYHKYTIKSHSHPIERLTSFIDTTSLPPQKRESFKLALQNIKPFKRSDRKHHEEEIKKILISEFFDKKKFKAKVQEKNTYFKKHHEQMLEIIAEMATHLNRKERLELSSIVKPPKRRRK